jgi:hypothetical protein
MNATKTIPKVILKNTKRKPSTIKEKINFHNILNSKNLKEIKELYVDGNNMLFIYKSFRDLCIGKNQNRSIIDQKFINFFQHFHQKLNFKKTTLIFDDTKLKEFCEENFSLICAKPKYQNADDCMLELSKDGNNSKLFLTSDANLRELLNQHNVRVCGSKHFLIELGKSFEIQENQIESWFHQYK